MPVSVASPIRIVIVADVRLYREGLAAVLPHERFAVVGSADSRTSAAAVVQATTPDIVLVDVAAPDAFDLMRQLRVDPPAVGVVAFGVGDDLSTIVECAEAGAVGYVPTAAGLDEFVATIEGAIAGELRCPPKVAGELFRRVGDRSTASRSAVAEVENVGLTVRQRQVHAMLRQHLSNKEIASLLNISEATVKNHVHIILEKLQVPSRAKAATCLLRPNRGAVRSGRAADVAEQRQPGVPLAIA